MSELSNATLNDLLHRRAELGAWEDNGWEGSHAADRPAMRAELRDVRAELDRRENRATIRERLDRSRGSADAIHPDKRDPYAEAWGLDRE